MKKLILTIVLQVALFSVLLAQAPQKINYQGVARNASGQALANQAISLKLSVLDGSASGTLAYSEIHAVTTNAMGLFNVAIGTGTNTTGSMAAVIWANGDKYLKVEMDPAGGTAYTLLGTSQLLAVPYALRSEDAGGVTIYNTGIQNANKMVVQHSPAYPTWGLQYCDTTDQFRFLSSGSKVFEVDLGSRSVNVYAPLKITSGSPGVDKVLTSDATGNASWSDMAPYVSAFQPLGCQVLASPTNAFQKIADMGTFVKKNAVGLIELTLQTNLYAETLNIGVVYELRVDGAATTVGNATALIREQSKYIPAIITGVFPGLAAGNHTVSLWAKAAGIGTASNVMYDAGCFNNSGTNNVLVKEYK